MIKVTGLYHGYSEDPNKRKRFCDIFESLKSFEDHILSLPGVRKRSDDPRTGLTHHTTVPYVGTNGWVCIFYIVTGDPDYPLLSIYKIENNEGIMFSNGKLTDDYRYINTEVMEFSTRCRARIDKPDYRWI